MSRLLFIDDENVLIEYSKKYFSKRNHVVLTAESGKEGLNLIKSSSPDLVILDLKMDDLSGLEILQKVRESGNKVRIIILTGQNDKQTIHEAEKWDVSGFVSKPINLQKLEEIIESILKKDPS